MSITNSSEQNNLMKKRTTITTEKREIWIISEGVPGSHISGPSSSTERTQDTNDTALVTTEQMPPTTNEIDDSEKE
jgi:hypothetical protein